MPMRISLFTPDSKAILERPRFCSEDNDDEIRVGLLSRAHQNQRKDAPDNIFGRMPARLPIAKARVHRCERHCVREARAVCLRSLLRFRLPDESTRRRRQMEGKWFAYRFRP